MIIIGLVIAAVLIIPAAATGNGAQSGQHFNLNIIGKYNYKGDSDWKSGGNVIFCPLTRGQRADCRIYLAEGSDFYVLDGDGTDGVARFMLPRPYAEGEDVTDPANSAYTIYVRVLGKPGGTGKMMTGLCETVAGGSTEAGDVCISDASTWYSATNVSLASHSPNTNKASQKFVDVTHELTTVDLSNYYLCGDGDNQCGHVGLFDDNPFDLSSETRDFLYFWDVWNTDMKIIQLRFYPN